MWITSHSSESKPVDFDVLEESALAMAQATIYKAMKESRIKKSDLARGMNRPRSFITRMLNGEHNLTIKTFARAMAACGFELRFEKRPIQWDGLSRSRALSPLGTTCPPSSGTRSRNARTRRATKLVRGCGA